MQFLASNRYKARRAGHARRRWTALVAVFLLVAQVLLPFGQALAFDGGNGVDYQAMCLPDGFKALSGEQGDIPSVPTNAVPCPLCTLQLAPALPVPQDTAIFIIDAPVLRVSFGLPLQHTRSSIWREALQPSRAPPVSI